MALSDTLSPDIDLAWAFGEECSIGLVEVTQPSHRIVMDERHTSLGLSAEVVESMCWVFSSRGYAAGIIMRDLTNAESRKRKRDDSLEDVRVLIPLHMSGKKDGLRCCEISTITTYRELEAERDLKMIGVDEDADLVVCNLLRSETFSWRMRLPFKSQLQGWPFANLSQERLELLKSFGKLVMVAPVHGRNFEYDFWTHLPAEMERLQMFEMLDEHGLKQEKVPSRGCRFRSSVGTIVSIEQKSEVWHVLGRVTTSSGSSGGIAGISLPEGMMEALKNGHDVGNHSSTERRTLCMCLRLKGSPYAGVNRFLSIEPDRLGRILNMDGFPTNEGPSSPDPKNREKAKVRIKQAALHWQEKDEDGLKWCEKYEGEYKLFRKFAALHTDPPWSLDEDSIPDDMKDTFQSGSVDDLFDYMHPQPDVFE